MKKVLLSIALLLGATTASWAQSMIAYGFETTNSPLTVVTDGTVVPVDYTGEDFSGIVITGDGELNSSAVEAGTEGFPIGFTFNFDGKDMNQFAIGTDGIIFLGQDGVEVPQQNNPFLAFNSGRGADNLGIVPIGGMLGLDSTQISYKTYQEDGHNVLLVQYHNIGVADRWGDNVVAVADIQYRLYDTGNIQIKLSGFKPFDDASLNYCSFKIGIHGTGDDRLMVAAYDGSSTTTNDRLISYTATSYPADGTTYTFSAPEPCATPTTQGSALQLNASSLAISGSFAAAEDADHYLVLVGTADPTEVPVDKTQYNVGDSLGNSLVAANVSDTTFATREVLTSSTTYKVNVYSYNSRCLNGPLYNTASPLSGEVKTLAGAPSALSVVDADSAQITLSVVSDPEQDAFIIYTDSAATNRWGQTTGEGVFGTPTGTLAVGDEVEGGGKVAYIGKTSDNVVVTGLEPSTTYYFRAYTTDGNGGYSSLYIDAKGSTAFKVPFNGNFSESPTGSAPNGWTAVGDWYVQRNGTVENRVTSNDASDGLVQSLTSPAIYLGEKANRVKTYLAFYGYASWSDYAYTFVDGDTVAIQVSGDGKNFTNVQTFTGEAGTAAFAGGEDSYVTVMPAFTDFANQKAYIRIYVRTHGTTRLSVGDFLVEQKPDCDYPINVRDSVVNGSTAILTWDLQGEEGTWEYSYKKSSDSEWSDNIRTNERSATIEGLDGLTKYDFRVRAVCDSTHQSAWSDDFSFVSGTVVPFNLNFGDLTTAPTGWSSYTGVLADPTVLEAGSDFRFYHGSWDSYLYFSNYTDTTNCWYVSPSLDLTEDNTKGIVISMDAHMSGSYYSTNSTDQKIYFVLSHDGENFYKADTVYVINTDGFYQSYYSDSTYTSDTIKNFSAKSRLGIYTTGTGSTYGIEISKLSMQYVDVEAPVVDAIDRFATDSKESEEVVARYNEAGQVIQTPQRGLNIVRMKDGTVKKVFVR